MKLELSMLHRRAPYAADALALDQDTGVAVFVNSERTHAGNQRLAEERLVQLLAEATSPGDWIR